MSEIKTEKAVRSLEARYYTDPEIYAREQKTTFAKSWLYAGHVSQLVRTGDYFAFEVADESLFCVRDKTGQVKTFYNVCAHRAHKLVEGTGSKRMITCPYHNWAYDLEGKLRNGPNLDQAEGFEKSEVCLTEVKTEIFCGFIFINMDVDAKPMSDWFPGVEEELRSFVPHIDQLKPLEHVEIPENCNWKVSVENYSECYHCGPNHPTFTTGVVKPSTYSINPQGYALRHTTECVNLDSMSYPIDLNSNAHAGDYSSWYLWPTFSFQVYPGNVLNTYHWRPVGVDQCEVVRGWYTIDGVESDMIRNLAVQDKKTTVDEDILLIESVQKGLKSRGYVPGPLVIDPNRGVESEHSLVSLQSWMRDFVDEKV